MKQRLECTTAPAASPRHLGFIRWPKIGFGGVKAANRVGEEGRKVEEGDKVLLLKPGGDP